MFLLLIGSFLISIKEDNIFLLEPNWGNCIAFISGITYSIFIIKSQNDYNKQKPLSFLFTSLLYASITSFLFLFFTDKYLYILNVSYYSLLLLLLVAIISQIGGVGLVLWTRNYLDDILIGIVLLFESVFTFFYAILIFGTTNFSIINLCGMMLIFTAILIFYKTNINGWKTNK